MQFIMFMKNVSMLGGALLITQLGPGPWSLDAQRNEIGSRLSATLAVSELSGY